MSRVSTHVMAKGAVSLIRMISRFAGFPLFKVHAFFVDGVLIDTGFARGRDQFLKLLDTLHPEVIVNTHHHEDHTGNNFWMTKKYGLLPLAHSRTSSYLEVPSQWVPFYRRVVWGCPQPSRTGQLDSEVRSSQFHFLVIPTPGHTDDHICLYEPNERWLFSGDLFIGGHLRYLRYDEDIYSVLDSLKRIATLRLKRMFCSFSGTVDNPKEAIDQKVDYLEHLKSGVEKGLQRGLDPREIRQELLGRGDRFRFVTGGQISKQNLINAFLKNPSSPQRVAVPAYRPCTMNRPRAGEAGAVGTEGEGWSEGKGVEP